jgi:hypothetical protein
MNFALILFILTVFTGVLWVADKMVFARQRRERAAKLLADFDTRNAAALARREAIVEQERRSLEEGAVRQPAWLEYTASFFPVILLCSIAVVLHEPFRIPPFDAVDAGGRGSDPGQVRVRVRLPVSTGRSSRSGSRGRRRDGLPFPLNPSRTSSRVIGFRVTGRVLQAAVDQWKKCRYEARQLNDADRMQYYRSSRESLGRQPSIIVNEAGAGGAGLQYPPGACHHSGSGIV